jgi:hypothetical protein
VGDVDPTSRDNRYLDALLLDCGALAGPMNAVGAIRDDVVALDGGNDLLLGRAFLTAGPVLLHATFFVLERLREVRGAQTPKADQATNGAPPQPWPGGWRPAATRV